jgi:Transposase DDE domain
MERELWSVLYRTVRAVAADFTQKYVQIPGWVILLTVVWAALHDRPLSWACDPDHWQSTRLRLPRLPSPATVSRRADSVGLGLLWRAVQERLRAANPPASWLSFLDGKPLPVGGCSKDRDARYGRGAGTMDRGYKLHAVWSNGVVPEAWEVTPLNVAETVVARRLIPSLAGGGYLLADGDYDVNALFDLAWQRGYQLVTPAPKAPPGRRRQSPQRLRSIALVQGEFGRALYRQRIGIEEAFGHISSFGGGLGPLPAWVRGLPRVRTWVWAKLLINAARIMKNKHLRQP